MTEQLTNHLFAVKKEIAHHWQQIDSLRKEEEKICTQIYKTCNHEWVIDTEVVSEHTQYICKNCHLDRSGYMSLTCSKTNE